MLKKHNGFTMIEVLIVVAIIGILAAVLIPSAITAIQKSKQKSTMKDIVSIATAASDFAADNGEWDISQSGDINSGSEFVLAITPFHIKICPVVDHWGQPYKVYLGAKAAVLRQRGLSQRPRLPPACGFARMAAWLTTRARCPTCPG